MREAKFVATVFGTVTACLIGGLAVASAAAPDITSRDNIEIVESASEELTIAATETSVSTATEKSTTTAITTTAPAVTDAGEAEKEINVSFDEAPTELLVLETTYIVTEPVTTTTTAPETTTTTEEETTTTLTTTAAPATTTAEAADNAEPTAEPDEDTKEDGGLPVSESDFILLCNVVGHEAGSNWISEYDKACVVEVIMNRVNSPLYPNTIRGVLTQPYQFSGNQTYVNLGTYSYKVTESVKNAVMLYFNETSQFSHGYLSFTGDGKRNYFR